MPSMTGSPRAELQLLSIRSAGTNITFECFPASGGFHRSAVAPGDWQPSDPAVAEDDDPFDLPVTLP
eukprot:4190519-Pyramimonas_sp.AAC.1